MSKKKIGITFFSFSVNGSVTEVSVECTEINLLIRFDHRLTSLIFSIIQFKKKKKKLIMLRKSDYKCSK